MTTNVVFVISLVQVRLIALRAQMIQHRTQTPSLQLPHHLLRPSLVILMKMAVTQILNLCPIRGRPGRALKIYVTTLTTTSMKTILGPCTRSIVRLTSSPKNLLSFIKLLIKQVFLTSDYTFINSLIISTYFLLLSDK